MSELLLAAAVIALATVAAGLVRVVRGPDRADRLMAVQLFGSGGIATLLLLAVGGGQAALLDAALVLAVLAAFITVAFVKAVHRP